MSAAAGVAGREGEQSPDLASIVQNAQDSLAHAIRVGRLRDDPLCAALEAMGISLDAQRRLHDANVGQMREVRQPIDPAAVQRLEKAAATGAARQASELARVHSLRTVLIGATVLVGAVLLAVAGGFWWGHNSAVAAINSTEAGVQAAFRGGPEDAAGWLGLMQKNDFKSLMAPCTGKAIVAVEGRRACGVGVWIDPPRNAAPALVSTGR